VPRTLRSELEMASGSVRSSDRIQPPIHPVAESAGLGQRVGRAHSPSEATETLSPHANRMFEGFEHRNSPR